ncbi:SPOR domain-containing protein [Thiomicrospira microaerophila]|uniref:SPOR domain-containing protein n=1 Tax=Thiomicrospira microaerophila TaxID=406020 RepID=UPI00200ECD07|nr:SPOR domain-containing protein [Thiomicrospira microaerophila]UQB42042.1 SPOR domain-containing protein [Thiomicrospira microaerophila]
MARDLRHGPSPKFEFQRRSQQMQADQENHQRRKLPFTGKIGLFFLALVTAFLIISHFIQQFQQRTSQSVQVNEVYQPPMTEKPVEKMETTALQPTSSKSAVREVEIEESISAVNYSFYTELPRMEVVVDVEPLPIKLPEPMWIQAGSFRDLAQAQREQQRLSAEGRAMLISPIETQNGRFYRMMLGPFTDRLALNQQRNALRRLGADTRVVKAPASTLPLD